MAQLFANNVSVQLASDLGATDTHAHLKAGHGVQIPTIATTDANFVLITIVDKDGNVEIAKVIEHVGTTDTITFGSSEAVPHTPAVGGRAYEAVKGVQTALAITATDNHAIKICPTAGSMQTALSFTAVTASPAEINSTCDGNTATAAEIKELHSAGAVNADFVKLHALTESAALIDAAADLLDPSNRTVGDLITEVSAGTMGAIAAGALNYHLKGAGAGVIPAWGALALSDTGVKIGGQILTNSDTTHVITGVGFSPSVVIIVAVSTNSLAMSVGFDDGSTAYCLALRASSGYVGGGASYYVYDSASGYESGKITAKSSDGFTLTQSGGSSSFGGYLIYLALP